jgi:hypothetical protein
VNDKDAEELAKDLLNNIHTLMLRQVHMGADLITQLLDENEGYAASPRFIEYWARLTLIGTYGSTGKTLTGSPVGLGNLVLSLRSMLRIVDRVMADLRTAHSPGLVHDFRRQTKEILDEVREYCDALEAGGIAASLIEEDLPPLDSQSWSEPTTVEGAQAALEEVERSIRDPSLPLDMREEAVREAHRARQRLGEAKAHEEEMRQLKRSQPAGCGSAISAALIGAGLYGGFCIW